MIYKLEPPAANPLWYIKGPHPPDVLEVYEEKGGIEICCSVWKEFNSERDYYMHHFINLTRHQAKDLVEKLSEFLNRKENENEEN